MRLRLLLLTILAFTGLDAQIRVNVGGPQFTDTSGNIWAADNGCTSTSEYTYAGTISGTPNPTLYQTGRVATSTLNCTYTVPANAYYMVTLKFAEYNPAVTARTTGSGANPRLMNIFINNVRYYSAYNVRDTCGFATACDLSPNPIPVNSSNTGQISITITQQQGQPMLSALAIDTLSTPTGFVTLSGIPAIGQSIVVNQLSPATATWADPPSVLYPQSLGAKCDGITDDTLAFQVAINTASVGTALHIYSATNTGCVVDALTLKTGTSIVCDGDATLLARSNNEIMINIGSGINRAGLVGIGGYCTLSGNGHTGFQAIGITGGGGASLNNIFRNILITSSAIGIETTNTYFDLFENIRVVGPTTAAYEFETNTNSLNCINCSAIAVAGTPIGFSIHNSGSVYFNGTIEGTLVSLAYQLNDANFKVDFENTGGTNTGAWIQVGTQTGTSTSTISFNGSTFGVGAQYGIDVEQVSGLVVTGNSFNTTLGAVFINNSGSVNGHLRGLDIHGNQYNIGGAGYNPAKILIYAGATANNLSNNVSSDSPNPTICSPVKPGTLVVPPDIALSNDQGVSYCDGATGQLNYRYRDNSGALHQNILITSSTLSPIGIWPNIVQPGGGSVANALVATLTDITNTNLPVVAGLQIVFHLTGGLSLQAGANTLNLNGHGADSIVNNRNLAGLSLGYSNGAYIPMMFDGSSWQVYDFIGLTALTGDVTASGAGVVAATLAASGVSAATYGDSTHIPIIQFDAKGRATSASTSGTELATKGSATAIGTAVVTTTTTTSTSCSSTAVPSGGGTPTITCTSTSASTSTDAGHTHVQQ